MYIDSDLATKRGLLGKVKVYLNGRIVKGAKMAKSGKRGVVEFYDDNVRFTKNKTDLITHKMRGNVKISLSL